MKLSSIPTNDLLIWTSYLLVFIIGWILGWVKGEGEERNKHACGEACNCLPTREVLAKIPDQPVVFEIPTTHKLTAADKKIIARPKPVKKATIAKKPVKAGKK